MQSTLDFSDEIILIFLFLTLLFGTTFIELWTFDSWFSLSIFSYFNSISTIFLSDFFVTLLFLLPLPVILCNVLMKFGEDNYFRCKYGLNNSRHRLSCYGKWLASFWNSIIPQYKISLCYLSKIKLHYYYVH